MDRQAKTEVIIELPERCASRICSSKLSGALNNEWPQDSCWMVVWNSSVVE